ncbi:MAG: hypothetical protein K2O45_15755 [Oscillospiraceae bacterium]|nr:hypothetical protein [Oscillospiraceae bacterium]
MKKKWEVCYFVTAVASIPVYKTYGKMEAYRQAAKDGWGTVYRDETNTLVYDEDCSASLYSQHTRKSVKFGGKNVAWTALSSLTGVSPPASSALPHRIFPRLLFTDSQVYRLYTKNGGYFGIFPDEAQ